MFFRFRLAPLLVALFSVLPKPPSHAQNAPTSPWQIDFAGPRGVSISYRGVPILRRSSLYVVKPGWAGLLFDQRAEKVSVEKRDNGALHVESQNADFASRYDLIPRDDSTFEMRFTGDLKRDVPAEIEFAAGYFNANLIANRPFEAQKSGADAQIERGVVPAFPKLDGLMENDLSPDFQKLGFDSRIGQIEVEVESKSRVAFADARRDSQNWAKEAPVFWLGWTAGSQALKFDVPVEMTLQIRVKASVLASNTRLQTTIKPALQPVSDALSTRDKPLEVAPRPQKMTLKTGAPFVLGDGTKASLTTGGGNRLSAALQRVLQGEWKINTALPRMVMGGAAGGFRITLGDKPPTWTAPATIPDWKDKKDAYRLIADQNGIEITAPTEHGAFYGIQTLAQLVRPDGKNARVAPVEIEDYPALQFRGAHWFPSASGLPFHKKLIAVMARYKMNAAVIQCEAAKWDSHPEIAAPNSISKADLRELVALCRANFIEPIPLINTPGHAEWMFRNGQNLDLAEDPQKPYAYAFRNPKSLDFIHQIMGEAIEVFQPKTFHIGHDEVTHRGRFPNPKNPFYRAGETTTGLMMENLASLYGWLKAQGIETMVWSDMFLHPDEGPDAASASSVVEAKLRRQMLPKDVIVADWHYGSNEKYPSLGIFAKDGIRTVAATWNTPQNIRYFSRAARENGSLGMLQTTWAGYFPDATVTSGTQLSQFTAFVLAGDYAWSGRDDAPNALPYDVVAAWSEAYSPQKGGESAGETLDLTPAATVSPQNWLGLGAGRDLSAIFDSKSDAQRFDNTRFKLPAQKLIVLSNAPRDMAPLGSQRELQLEIGAPAAQIALLHSSLWSVPNAVIAAKMSAEYADGTQVDFDLKTGSTLASWQSEDVALNARRGWSAKSPDGTPLGLRVTRWENPFPTKIIARLRFTPVDVEAGYALAGVTLIDAAPSK